MSNEDRPDVGKFGGPPDEIDEGTLLFQPSGSIDPDDDDFLPPDPEPPSRGPLLWVVAAVVVLGATFGLQFLGGRDVDDTPPEAMPVVPSVPVDTTSRAELRAIPEDTVRGAIGSSVRLGVRAIGRTGAPMRDTLLRFQVERGRGSLRTEEVATSGEGIAVTFMDLPATPGQSTVSVSLPGSDLEPAIIVALALPGPPARISISSGDRQEAEVGRLVPERARVTVHDAAGNPVPGAIVSFRIASGDGVSAPSQTRTDSLGQAGALWRMGPLEGEQTLTASLSGVGSVTFSATATPAATLEFNNPESSAASPVTVVRDEFAVGGGHVCSTSGGTLSCRGSNERGQAAPAGSMGFVALAAGASHTCGLSSAGVASCWGANDEGQLGDGSDTDRAAPARVQTEYRFSTLAAGESHTCGLAGAGIPLCWGENLSGQIGDGSRNNQDVPRTVGGGLGFREITAGWSHTCGRTPSGNTWCWGLNNRGQLGDGTNVDQLQPVLVVTGAEGLVAGSAHTCGIGGGQALCWGANASGQLGDGTTTSRNTPTPVTGLPGRPTALAAGAVHTCALLSDGRVFCWGQNRQGQLGDGTNQDRLRPVEVVGGLRFSEIDAGGAVTCGLASDGVRYCWGFNLNGQLGDGSRTSRSAPTRSGG